MFNFGILPLRAIAFQALFLLMAIALEAVVLYQRLPYGYKTSVQYAATLNLLSTFLGWVVFFNLQTILPDDLRIQVISFLFFEQFFPNAWMNGVTSLLGTAALGTFLGVVVAEWGGLDLLDRLLESRKSEDPADGALRSRDRFKLRRMLESSLVFRRNDRAYTILVANSLSFSAIVAVLLLRWIEQTYFSLR